MNRKPIDIKLKNISFVVATHKFATGPSDALVDFLLSLRVPTLLYITHTFHYSPERRSSATFYKYGRLVKEIRGINFRAPDLIAYIKDLAFTIFYVLYFRRRYHIYVGVDLLNALAGLILRAFGIVDIVIFYTIDYIPRRFSNYFLNSLYHTLDKLCVEKSNFTWNLSAIMAEARKRRGIKKINQLVVPMGGGVTVNFEDNFERNTMIFVGNLRRGQGLELVIKSFPKIVKEIPDAKLIIIGTGPILRELKELVDKLGLNKHIRFTGYMRDHELIRKLVSKAALGIAMYEPNKDNFTWFADPGKIKLYLVSGIPVITTKVPPIAKEIQNYKAGAVIEYNEETFANTVISLLKDDNEYYEMRSNAQKLGSKYLWPSIFRSALEPVFII
jgi:glycosyltransferase involved in cell wall biosynthesis